MAGSLGHEDSRASFSHVVEGGWLSKTKLSHQGRNGGHSLDDGKVSAT